MMKYTYSKWSLAVALLLQASHVKSDSIEFGFYTKVPEGLEAAALVSLFVLVISSRVLYSL